jgi:uncharacterized RDD family membrane protein YckC
VPQPNKPQTFGDVAPSKWPGERLGLPNRGSRSIARVGRRTLALILDITLALLTSFVLFGNIRTPESRFFPILVFAALQILFIPTIGGSIGHRICGMRLVSLDGRWVGAWRPALRTALLLLVVPALVWDSDQRAFHDKIAGTVLIRS